MLGLRFWACGVPAVVMACSVAWGQQAGIRVSKETTGITEPLGADGLPDYVAAINARYGKGVTAENNGFVLWWGVMPERLQDAGGTKAKARIEELLGVKGTEPRSVVYENYFLVMKRNEDEDHKLSLASRRIWSEKDYPKVAEYLQDMKPVLDVIAEAATKERWWCPAVMRDDGTPVLAPSMSEVPYVVRMYCARAMLRFGAGNFDGFLKDYVTARRLAAHATRSASASDRTSGHLSGMLMADGMAGAAVATGKLTLEQCQMLSKAVDGVPTLEPMVECVDVADRWSMLAGVCRFAAAPDNGALARISFRSDGSTYMEDDVRKRLETIDRGAVDWNLVLKRVNSFIDIEIAAVRLPHFVEARDAYEHPLQEWRRDLAELKRAVDLHRQEGESTADYSERVARAMVTAVAPQAGGEIFNVRPMDMYEPMMRALLAAAMFKAKRGDWPDRLEQVVPELLPAIGKDLYSEGAEAPLSYIVSTRGPRVYSVGRNGKDEFGQQVSGGKQDDPHVGAEETELR